MWLGGVLTGGNKIKLVLIIADSKVGGGPNHILGILRNIDKEKFDCYLICPFGYLSVEAKLIGNVKVINVPMKSKFDLVSIFQLRKELQKIRALGDPFGPMVVHSHGPRASLMAHLSPFSDIKQVYTEHIYSEEYGLKNPINGWIQRMMLKNQNRKRNLVIAVSTSVKDFLIKSGIAKKERVVVIPNGIELKNSEFGIKNSAGKSALVIGVIGSLNESKGFEYLIEAMPRLKKKYPLLSLEIIGDGPEKKNLIEGIEFFGLERNISLLGQKKNIFKYLKHWKVLVIPSLTESFGIVALEAMSAGIPVVASRVGGLKDIITNKKNGLLVPPKSPKEIAKAVGEIIQRPVLAAKLRREGRERAKDFDLKSIVKRLEEVYISLFDGEVNE